MRLRLHIWLLVALEVAGLLALATSEAYATRYRSVATGNWATAGTWERSLDGGLTWTNPSPTAPSSTATDTVLIQVGHVVSIGNGNRSCRTLTIEGTMNWNFGRTLTIGTGGLGDLVLIGGTLQGTTGTAAVEGAMSVPASFTGTVQGITLTVTGLTSISGTLQFTTSANGTKTFIGGITINNGGTWTNSINEAIVFRGGLTNNGTFTSGTGTHTFNTNSQILGGSSPITFSGIAAIAGAITVTNNGTVTVAGNLTGNNAGSTWLNAAGSILNVNAAAMATGVLNATDAPNTVNYTGAAQTVKATTFSNLFLSGSGTKTTTGVTVLDTLSRRETAAVSAAPTYSERAVLEYQGSGAQTTGPEFPSPMSATVLINNANGVTLDAIKTVNDSIVIRTGSLSDGGFQITGNAADSLVLEAGTSLVLTTAGATPFPTNFGTNLSTTSTVVYGGGTQTIAATPTYGNLIVQAAGVKSTGASSTLTVVGDLTLASGTTFQPGSGSIIDLSGSWTNNGATFTAGTSVVQFVNTLAAQNINGSVSGQTFNAITVAKSGTALSVGGSTTTLTTSALTMTSGTFNIAPATTVNGTLTLTGGTLAVGTSSLTLNSTVTGTGTTLTSGATGTVSYNQGSDGQSVHAANYGNLTFSNFNKTLPNSTVGISGTFTPGSATGHTIAGNTIDFNGSGAQTIAVFTYQHLSISGPRGGQTVTLASGTVEIKGDLNVTATAVSYSTTGNTVSFTGATAQAIDAFTFNNATVNNAAGVTLDGTMTVNGALTLTSGNITTGASRVIIASGGTVSRTSGHVVGTLERGVATGSPTVDYALGTASVYTPVTVAFSSVSVSGSLTATTTDGDHPQVATSGLNSAKSVNRYWTLVNSGIVFAGADVTLNFDATDIDGSANASLFDVASYESGIWTGLTTGTRTGTSTQATGVTSFGEFQVAEPFTGVTYTWDNGGGTSAWTTAANWDPNGIPGASDNAIINTAVTVEVSDARSVTSLTIEHASALFRVTSSGSMSVGGNLVLTDGTIETQAAFPTVTGSFSMAAGTVQFTGTGSQTIPAYDYVNLTSTSTGARVLASSGTIGIAGVFTPGPNSYTVTGSTIDYNGSGSQTIAAFGYSNLTSSSTGTRTLASSGTIGIAGVFIPGNNSYTITGSTIDFTSAGAQTIPAAVYNNLSNSGNGNRTLASSDTIRIAGTFTPGSGTYTTTGSTVEFTGSGTQTIPAVGYHNLVSSGGGSRTLSSSGTIGIAGGFDPGSNAYTVTGSTIDFTSAGAQTIPATIFNNLNNSGNGDRTLASSGTIEVIGTFTPGSGAYTSTGSTVEFSGSGPQTIPAIAYDNLTSSNTGARTLASSGTIGIAGAFTPGTNSYTVAGSTVDFNGSGSQSIPAFAFNDLTISGSRGGGTLTLAAGTVGVGGTFTPSLSNAIIDPNGGTIDFSSSGPQTIPAFTYHDLTNSGDGDRTLASSGTIRIEGDFAAGSGAYTVTGSTVAYSGSSSQSVPAFSYASLTVDNAAGIVMAGASTVSGTLTLTDGTVELSADTLAITSTGSVSRTSGWIAGPLRMYLPTGATSRTYHVGDAAVYAPVDVAFANITTAGDLAVTTTSNDHPDVGNSDVSVALNANRYWTLRPNGIVFTTYNATVHFDVSDVDVGADPTQFIVDLYDGGTWLSPTTGTVTATSTQATGLTAFGDFVTGIAAASLYTSTTTGGSWNAATTWVNGVVPGNNANVVIATTGGNAVTLTANPSNVASLVIDAGAILQGNGTPVTMNLNQNATNFINNGTFNANGVTVRLARASTWDGTGTFNMDAIDLNNRALTFAFASPETVSVSAAGNPFLNVGTLNPGTNSYVRFDGTAAQTLGVSSANLKFNGLIIDNTAGVTSDAAITGTKVSGDIIVSSGFFDDGGFNVNLASNKDFTVEAGATYRTGGTTGLPVVAGTGVVTLDTASAVVYYGSTQVVTQTTYGDLTIQNAGTKTFESDTTRIAGDFTVTGATIDATTNLSTIEFIGSGPQSIPAITYYRLLVTGTGTVSMAGPISLGSDLEIKSGVFDNNGSAVTMSAGRSVYLFDNATFRAGGTTSVPAVSGGGALSFDSLSVVEYYGSAQAVQAVEYGTLRFLNVGTKTIAAGTTTIIGDLTISGATGSAAVGSTVIYAGPAAQSVGPMDYDALQFTSSGLKTLSGSASTAALTQVASGAAFRITATGSMLFGADIENDGIFENEGTITVP